MSRRIQTYPSPVQPRATEPGSSATLTDAEVEGEALILGVSPKPVAYATTSHLSIEPEGYLDRLVKYIPAEIIALYLGASNVVPTQDADYHLALWTIAGLTTIATPIYMYFATREEGQPTLWSQIAISSLAFPVWVFAIGGPFESFDWYAQKRWIAAIVITFATFIAGIYKPHAAAAKKIIQSRPGG
jgi:hypothetical protein